MTPELIPGFWYDSIDSTMDEARRLIQAGRIQGQAFVVADQQTAGRGTQGRTWLSPPGAGLYLTVVHAPVGETLPPTGWYTLAAGVACVEAIEEATGMQPGLKPINDLYIAGKKLGGILVESELQTDGFSQLLTGIGINLADVPRMLPGQDLASTSLAEIMGTEAFGQFSFDDFCERVVAKICFWQGLVQSGQRHQVGAAWERHCMPGHNPEEIRAMLARTI